MCSKLTFTTTAITTMAMTTLFGGATMLGWPRNEGRRYPMNDDELDDDA